MSTIEIRDLVLYKRNQQRHGKKLIPLIKNLGALFESGKINAIMGPNGSSKTTLLDILYGVCDQSTETSGSILYNGKDREAGEWFSRVSYSEQDYCMMEGYTVMDAIRFSMSMCHGNEENVKELIKSLHLEKVASTRINIVSGGERKRAMIAISMAMGRKILILDEPTSDLDSRLAYKVTRYLKDLAIRHDIMVIMTVHQPSPKLFDMFDNLLFMYDGMDVYSGPVSEVVGTMASKGIVQPESWTTAEFLSEVFGDVSSFEEVKALRPHINNYIRELGIRWEQNNAELYKKNGTMQYCRIEPKHVWLLTKRQLLIDFVLFGLIRSFVTAAIFVPYVYVIMSQESGMPLRIAGIDIHVENLFRSFDPCLAVEEYFRITLVMTLMHASSVFANKPQLQKELPKNLYNPLSLCISTIIVEVVFNLMLAVTILAGLFIVCYRIMTIRIVVMILCDAIFVIPSTMLIRLTVDRIIEANYVAGHISNYLIMCGTTTCFPILSSLMESFPRAKIMFRILMWVILSLCPAYLIGLFMKAIPRAKVMDQVFGGDLTAAGDSLRDLDEWILSIMQLSSVDPRWFLYGSSASLILVLLLVLMLFPSCFSSSVRLRTSRK